MKTTNRLTWGFLLTATTALAQTDRVGIGTTSPRAGLDITHDDGFVATGQGPDLNTGDPGPGNSDHLPAGAGSRLMWLPKKAAFRAGHAFGTEWDYANVGLFSVALGANPTASGAGSLALGEGTTASGPNATAIGAYTTASAGGSLAIGLNATASGMNSTALGVGTTASAEGATALGKNTLASGEYSTAQGGYASTNGKGGSFVIGDFSDTQNLLLSTTQNEFSARFAGGYRLLTTPDMTLGVSLSAGGNAWQTISDSTKKEGFRPADGAQFLRKIAGMRLGSWNYKGQDARTMRHYGPMAQDFFAAFGHDGMGIIGTDTTINGADFDGINLIAIQALTYKTERLEAENRDLRRLLGELAADVQRLKATASAAAR